MKEKAQKECFFLGLFCFLPWHTAGTQQFGQLINTVFSWSIALKEKSIGWCLVGSLSSIPSSFCAEGRQRFPTRRLRPPVPSPRREAGPCPSLGTAHSQAVLRGCGGVLPGAREYRCGLWIQLPSISCALSFLGHESLNQQQWINYTKKIWFIQDVLFKITPT